MKPWKHNLLMIIRVAAAILFAVGWLKFGIFLSDEAISEVENRQLAEFPRIFSHYQWNYHFGTKMEDYLKDHFPYRQQLIEAKLKSVYRINGYIENDRAFVTENGWMFFKTGTINPVAPEKQKQKAKETAALIKRFNEQLYKRGKKLYVILVPDKNDIYYEEWTRYWRSRYTPYPRVDRNLELIKELSDEPNVTVLYPREEIISASRKEDVFSREGVHFMKKGGEIVLQRLYAEIKEQYMPETDVDFTYSFDNFSSREISNALGFSDTLGNFSQNVTVHWKKPDIEYRELEHDKFHDIYEKGEAYPALININAHILGFCYGMNQWFPLFKYMFRKTSKYQLIGAVHDNSDVWSRQKERLRKMIIEPDNGVVFLGLDVNDEDIYRSIKEVLKDLE